MSLIRFLSSGSRGLTKGAEPMGRYRLPDGRLIPNFAGGKNPFESKRALPGGGGEAPWSSRPLAAVRGGGVSLKRAALKTFQGLKRLTALLAGLWPRRKARFVPATSSNPQRSGPVQGEFALEKVRVVRNDLTDTDYEVVSAETLTASPVKQVPRTVSLATETRPLGRLAERLFSHQKPH